MNWADDPELFKLLKLFKYNYNVPYKWKREAEDEGRIRDRFGDAILLTLKMEKRNKMDIPPGL